MKKITLIALAGVALATMAHAPTEAASGNQGSTKDYYESGYWKNYYGISNTGSKMCGAKTNISSDKSVHIKSDGTNVYLYLFKDSWRIPEGASIQIQIGFDQGHWGGSTGMQGETLRGSNFQFGTINSTIRAEWVADFLSNFKEGNRMWFRFSGNEQPWIVDLTGSREVATVLETCMAKIRNDQPTTQPYSTQPYTSQPSQPFVRQPTQPAKQGPSI